MKDRHKIEKLEKQMKDVNDALGLGNTGALNINMLLDTIREQANDINGQAAEINRLNEMHAFAMEYI